MAEIALRVEPREKVGKSASRRLRRAGKVPGVYYYHGQPAEHFTVDAKVFRTLIGGDHSVIDLDFGKGKPKPSIVRDVQFDPVSGEILHIDFLGVKLDEEVVVEVPLEFTGTPAGVKLGGILQVLHRHLEIGCLPLDIPESIEIDVSALDIHDSLTVAAIPAGKYKILDDPETVIVTVLPPRLEAEEVTEEVEGEAAEPEVVGPKGKKEEEREGESGKE